MTDNERKDLYSVFKDTQDALERAKSKLENATLEYLYAINRHHETVSEYIDDIQKLLNEQIDGKHED